MTKSKGLRVTFNAPLVLAFALLCTLVTILDQLTGRKSISMIFSTYASSFSDPMTYVRLFTHVLGHASFAHLVSNMAYILLLGPALEEKYGAKKLLLVIAVTAVITALVHNVLFPGTRLLGASGVVFAFIILMSFTGFSEGEIPLTFILIAVIFIGQQIYEGIFVKDDISQLTHIIGGIVGAIIGYSWNSRSGGKK